VVLEISWTDGVRNEEVLQRVKEERNILHTVNRREANWIGHILRRNCLLQYVFEGNIIMIIIIIIIILIIYLTANGLSPGGSGCNAVGEYEIRI
jgi:hypothetical protein